MIRGPTVDRVGGHRGFNIRENVVDHGEAERSVTRERDRRAERLFDDPQGAPTQTAVPIARKDHEVPGRDVVGDHAQPAFSQPGGAADVRAVRVREEYRGAGLAVDESRVAHVARRVGPRGNVGEARAAGNFLEAQVVPGQRDARGRAARSRADEAPVVHARYVAQDPLYVRLLEADKVEGARLQLWPELSVAISVYIVPHRYVVRRDV
mmetsp:Transcript_25332/g.78119  ORF Transcript_25332/g.78119 Transcript_25332/m.78119 type:complete len:209 (-) Transcript_25332:403-1029(-)